MNTPNQPTSADYLPPASAAMPLPPAYNAPYVPLGSEQPPANDGPTEPINPGTILKYSIANLGFGAFYALNNAVLPLFLKQYTQDARLLGLMGSTHSFEGAVIQPLVGSLSDRMTGKNGRRRPFMLIFVPLSVVFILLTPLAAQLPPPIRLAAIVAAIFLFTVFFNVAQDPYQALMPDITPAPQRGRVNGIAMFVGVVGQAGLSLAPLPVPIKFYLVALLMLVTTFATCFTVREPEHAAHEGEKRRPLAEIQIALTGLQTLQQARKALAALFLVGIGIGAVLPFLTVFVQKITHCSDQQAQNMFLVLMISTAVGVLPFGWLTDRVGPKRVLMVGLSLIAAAALLGLGVKTMEAITLVMVLAGLGNAAQTASAYPLLTNVVPGREIGFYTGLQSTALSIAAPLTALITGELVNKGGYRNIFAVCAVSIVGAIAILAWMRQEQATGEIVRREQETGGSDFFSASNAPVRVGE